MALSRKFLTALGIEPEKIDEIIEAHMTTVDGLKTERDSYKDDASKYKTTLDELETTKNDLATTKNELETLKNAKPGENIFEEKFNTLKEEYENYKADIEAKAVYETKEKAFRELLKEAGISERRFDAICKISKDEIESIEFDKDNKVKESDKRLGEIKDGWKDFIVTEKREGENLPNPFGGAGQKTPPGESEAAKIAARYHANLYGQSSEQK